jgi:hypothetical protein
MAPGIILDLENMPTVYFVTANSNANSVFAKAKEQYPDNFFEVTTDKFFVATDDTSLDVSKKLGIHDGSTGTGIVLRVSTYNGRAPSALWEWLGAKLS